MPIPTEQIIHEMELSFEDMIDQTYYMYHNHPIQFKRLPPNKEIDLELACLSAYACMVAG